MTSLALGGITPLSTIDFPGRLAAVLYTQGCPLRCRYCHNAELRGTNSQKPIDWDDTVSWLRHRQGLLDGIVFSGGEPTAQPSLPSAITQVKDLGFEVAIHTSGIYPARLAEVLPSLDWIGLDIKAPFDQYEQITGVHGSGTKTRRSLDAVLASVVAYEIRTTVHPLLLTPDHLISIARALHTYGVTRWVLQEFRQQGCQDTELVNAPIGIDAALVAQLREFVPDITVRRAT